MPITLEDIGYNQVLTKDYPLADLDLINDTYQDSLLGTSPKTQSSWWDEVTPEMLSGGYLNANISLVDGYLMSANYVENQAGWKIDSDGNLYANSGIFRGKLVAGEIHIPDEATVNSFHTNKYGDSWWGCTEENFNANVENAVAYILRNGTGKLADWHIENNFIGSTQDYNSSEIILDAVNSRIRAGKSNENNIIIDGGNSLIKSSNYTSGTSGFLISPDLIEAENLYARGKLSSVVFEYNVQQAVGGQLVVSSSDKLAEDMTADDYSTLTIDGDIILSVNDILRIKDADDDEFMRVQSRDGNTYTVQRDLANIYSSNQNPAWKKGTAVVVLGNSNGVDTFSGGWLEMLGNGLNSPYYSIISRTGVNYDAFEQIARFGNLKGFLDYNEETYGIAIGDSFKYFTYDPSNGIRMRSTKDSHIIEISSDPLKIRFNDGTYDRVLIGEIADDTYGIKMGDNTRYFTYDTSQGIRLRSTKGDYIIEISTDPLKIRLNDGNYDRIVIGETASNVYGIEIRSPSGVSMFDIDNNNQRISTADGKTYWDLGAGRFVVNDGITDRILIGNLG